MHARRACLRSIVLRIAASFALCALAACSDEAESRIELSFDPEGLPVQVDRGCETCAATALLRIVYPDDYFAEDEVIEFVAYRVDYSFGGELDGLPFYAQEMALSLAPGERQHVRMTLAGRRQHAFIAEHAGERGVTAHGTATLQLAGYDWNDEPLFVEIEAELELE